MLLTMRLYLFFFLQFSFSLYVRASSVQPLRKPSLERREIRFHKSCYRAPPNPQVQYRRKLDTAIADAKTLARAALDPQFKSSTAYQHYFRPQDFDQVNRTYTAMLDTLDVGGQIQS